MIGPRISDWEREIWEDDPEPTFLCKTHNSWYQGRDCPSCQREEREAWKRQQQANREVTR